MASVARCRRFLSFLLTLAVLGLCHAELEGEVLVGPGSMGIARNRAYGKVAEPTLSARHLADLPGFTRSVYARDHALIAPESQVYQKFPDWTNSVGAYLVTPGIGASFAMYLMKMQENSTHSGSLKGALQRIIFVLTGQVDITHGEDETVVDLRANYFSYVPPNHKHELRSTAGAMLLIYEKWTSEPDSSASGSDVPLEPWFVAGDTDALPVLPVPGEVFILRKLLPESVEYDFNIHVMDFEPGEYLAVKEVHYNQHGLLLLEGSGIYRLGDKWYPVQAGDAIWMAPFVPQWYAALGKTRTRYIIFKDTNRDPLLAS